MNALARIRCQLVYCTSTKLVRLKRTVSDGFSIITAHMIPTSCVQGKQIVHSCLVFQLSRLEDPCW